MTTLSEQQERFCRLIIEGRNQRDAYREAGYKTTNDEATDAAASRLLRSVKVADRIAELRKPLIEKAEVTLEWLLSQAQEILKEARKDGAHAASIAAIKELGVLSGERVETRQNVNRNANDTSELSRKELLDIARGRGKGTPAQANGSGNPDRVHAVH